MEPDGTYPMPKDGWVCFHCGERFKKYGTARDHFGEAPGKLLQCRALRAALERQQAVVDRLREDMMDAVEGLGVRPMCYNGLHRAWLNQTNADVKTFKTREECIAWCAETNRRLGTEDLEQTGNHISTRLERQQAVVKAARGYGRGEHGWPGRLEMALAALDAPPEGEG